MVFNASAERQNLINVSVQTKRVEHLIGDEDINFLTMESLILAQDERWRRASYMQVEREIHFGGWKVADG